ncbi:spermidine synthase [Streptomyces sp. URMC 126]|uniref:spermidine synthase n=1 Tax=Streptomyces sp. URMC 126 TaxID=3423401 RepID=UPI003F193C06
MRPSNINGLRRSPVPVPYVPNDPVTTLDRRDGPYGEVALRRRGGTPPVYEIIANGCFLMDTSDGRSERLLVDAALRALPAGRHAPAVLIGGLGVGFSLAHAAAEPRWGRITVVERERAVIDWHRAGPLSAVSGAALADPRVSVVEADLLEYLGAGPDGEVPAPADAAGEPAFDAICLDIDNGPDWTVTEDNKGLYSPAGLTACRSRLRPGGVLAVWSAQPSAAFEDALRNAGFAGVTTEEIIVARGVPDVVHLAVLAA